MGFATRLKAARGYSLISYGEGEKTIGIFGHSDVVSAGDGWLYTKPFEPIIRDGVMIGRGCADNKSGVMAALFATQIIKECKLPVKSRIQVFVGSNEESGMADLEEKVKGDLAFVMEQTPDGKILLTAKGASKHSAYPEGSANAVLLACKVLGDCATICGSDRHQMRTLVKLTEVTCQVTGEEYKPYWMMAGTYFRHLDNAYTIGSRVKDPNSKAVIPELPAGHGGAHQRDECCVVDDFLLGVRLLTHCILTCDREINR